MSAYMPDQANLLKDKKEFIGSSVTMGAEPKGAAAAATAVVFFSAANHMSQNLDGHITAGATHELKGDMEIVARKLQYVMQICIDREQYNEKMLSAPTDQLEQNLKKQVQFNFPKELAVAKKRKAMLEFYHVNLSIYRHIKKCLENPTSLEIDKVFLFLKISIYLDRFNVHNIARVAAVKKGDSCNYEGYFQKKILSVLKPYISKTLNKILDKKIFEFNSNSVVASNRLQISREPQLITSAPKILKLEIVEPWSLLQERYKICFAGITSPLPSLLEYKEIARKTEKEFGELVDKIAKKYQKQLKENFDSDQKIIDGDFILLDMTLEYMKFYVNVRKEIKPIRDAVIAFDEEIYLRNEADKIVENLMLKEKLYERIKKDMLPLLEEIQSEKEFFKKRAVAFEINLRALFNDACKISEDMAKIVQIEREEMRPLMAEDRMKFKFSLDHLKIVQNNVSDIFGPYLSLKKDIIMLCQAEKNKVVMVDASKAAADNTSLEKQVKPPIREVQVKKQPLSFAEFKSKIEKERLARQQKKNEERRALGLVAIEEAQAKDLVRRMRQISDEELSVRQERIKKIPLNNTIKSCFQKLYDFDFGHADFSSLVQSLKGIGEDIKVESEGSHFSASIGFHLIYVNDELAEKEGQAAQLATDTGRAAAGAGAGRGTVAAVSVSGKAFMPHKQKLKRKKNKKNYDEHIVLNLQNFFYHAGYTPEALQIAPSKKFDAASLKNC